MQHLDEGTLQAWLDGARSGLDPSRLARIEHHLAGCDACAARADDLARSSFRTHALLSLGRDHYAPRVSYEDVARRAGSRTREMSRRRRVAATRAAGIIGALAVGWLSNDLYRAHGGAEVDVAEEATVPSMATQPPAALAAAPTSESPGVSSAAPAESPALAAMTAPGTTLAAEGSPLVVSGFVADEGGRPLPSAQVYVAELDVGVLTQQDGRYDLTLPAEPDSFELTVERIGYRQQARAISGHEGDYVAADFRLREEALTLDEIVVTGESGGVPRRTARNMTNPRATPFVWRASPWIAAEGYVGAELWTLPGVDVMSLELAYGDNPNETHVARVRQDLGDGVTLTLIQGRTDGRRTRWPVQSAGSVQSTWRGEMLITATAPITTEALRLLLAQLR